MKQFTIIALLALMTFVSCAKEKDKKTNVSFGTDPYSASTLSGYFNPNSQSPIEVGTTSYRLSRQTDTQIIYRAMQQARLSQIQPLYVDGVAKYRANITGYTNINQNNPYNQYNQNPQYNNQPMVQPTEVTVTAINFY